jgi:choline dehydrogenase-like flavoprotein
VSGSGFLESEVVVVGSGPGGATVARELTRAGRQVLLLERGGDHRRRRYYGTYLGAALYAERATFLRTREGLDVIRPLMVGGATSMYCGCAAPPPAWLKERYGIDLDVEVDATVEELGIAPLPPELRGDASTRLAEAGRELGYDFQPQPKLVRPARARRFDCGATCMLGCRCGAKWSAAELVDEAVAAGGALRTGARVERVVIDGGRAVGVEGRFGHAPFMVRAETVVLAAGGLGTPRLLQASGFRQAGRGIAMDVTVIVYGIAKGRGNGADPPMTWSWEDDEGGVMLSTLVDPQLLYPLMAARSGIARAATWARWNRALGVMVKLKDELSGAVLPDGTISKPLAPGDGERLAAGESDAKRILARAGADPGTFFTSPSRGTHPSATVRIGAMLDTNLASEVPGLFVCDASVFPEALGRPTVLTIVALARRLASHLRDARP